MFKICPLEERKSNPVGRRDRRSLLSALRWEEDRIAATVASRSGKRPKGGCLRSDRCLSFSQPLNDTSGVRPA